MCELPLISIIIPMHNSAAYIERCLKSVLNQEYKNFEVILIDDHSIDNTAQICEKYCNNKSIKLILNKGTKGASASRNLGIDNAEGTYITFIDSDDIISKFYLSTLFKVANKYPNHLAMSGYVEFDTEAPRFDSQNITSLKKIPSEVILANIFYYHSSACCCLFRTELIKNKKIRFNESSSFNEDVYFTSKYISVCEGGIRISNKHYGYFINPNGIGAHQYHSKLTLSDVNHRAEGYLSLQDAIDFTNKYAPEKTKYIITGYSFIAAEVFLTAARADIKDFNNKKEIKKYLSLKHRFKFTVSGKSLMHILLVNGIAISPKAIKYALDNMNLLKLVKK